MLNLIKILFSFHTLSFNFQNAWQIIQMVRCINGLKNNIIYDFSPVDSFNPNYKKYPKFRKAEYIEVEQFRGELLIIPTGWYHQVCTLTKMIWNCNRSCHSRIVV